MHFNIQNGIIKMKKINLILIFTVLILVGCKGESTLTNVGGLQATTENSCVDKTIDVGNKGVAATNPRGTFSDIATVPGTNKYVTAYFDTATSTIKISYWNGSSFSHEVVAGDIFIYRCTFSFLDEWKCYGKNGFTLEYFCKFWNMDNGHS